MLGLHRPGNEHGSVPFIFFKATNGRRHLNKLDDNDLDYPKALLIV